MDFIDPTESQLEKLAKACQPATFGRKNEDVLDETYRKAGKLDAGNFSAQFTPAGLGIVKQIHKNMLRGTTDSARQPIHVELYKLNVYGKVDVLFRCLDFHRLYDCLGPGAFFKAHVDTPRSDNMFGSLVVVLPTAHEGGSLIFRRDGGEFTFDSANTVKLDPAQAAFAMFFSDVEHEVTPVTSGYRVTLTYNLYFQKDRGPIMHNEDLRPDVPFKDAFVRLLKDKTFLPDGGVLGFALAYKYPFNPESTECSDILNRLKGSDAQLKSICEGLSLEVAMKAVYRGRYKDKKTCIHNEFYNWGMSPEYDGDYISFLVDVVGAQRVIAVDFDDKDKDGDSSDAEKDDKNKNGDSGDADKDDAGDTSDADKDDNSSQADSSDGYSDCTQEDDEDAYGLSIVWVNPLKKTNGFNTHYAAFGNDACVSHAYGEVCLIATVAEADERIAKLSD